MHVGIRTAGRAGVMTIKAEDERIKYVLSFIIIIWINYAHIFLLVCNSFFEVR